MNAKQKREVIAVLAKDCAIGCMYMNSEGDTCAIGALGLAAGVSRIHLRRLHGEYISREGCVTLRRAIMKTFGLESDQLTKIQCANDKESTVAARREAVLAIVRRIKPLATP